MDTNGNNRHKQFVNQYQVDYKNMTHEKRNQYFDELNEKNKRIEEAKRKTKIKRAKNKRRKLIGRITAIGLAGIALVSGGMLIQNQHEKNKEENQPAMLDELLENEVSSLEELGIDEDMASRLEELDTILTEGNLTNTELIKLSKKISDLQFDITKSKLAGVLGVSQDDIKLYTYGADKDGKNHEKVEVYNKGILDKTYTNKDFLENSDTISPEISDMIRDIGSMQDVMQQLQEGDFKREGIINKYKDFLENTSQFAGMKLQIDEKGNITAEAVKVKDLDKYDKAVYDSIIKNTTKAPSNQQQYSTDEPEL